MSVLTAIGVNREVFSGIELEAAKAARSLVVKQLRVGDSDVKTLRDVRKALGKTNFVLLGENMSPAELKSLSTKFDKYRPQLKNADAAWRRNHICELADGRIDVSAKPPKT